MTTKSPRNHPIGPIDGIRRTQKKAAPVPLSLKPSAPPRDKSAHHALPERPLPEGLSMHHGVSRSIGRPVTPVQAGELVSHPSLPLPTASPSKRRTKTSLLRQVLLRSYRVDHDVRSTRAILIATLLNPVLWFFIASPWILSAITEPGSAPWNAFSRTLNRLLGLSYTGISIRFVALILGLFLIWIGRHALLLVSHAVHVRQIDHRLSDSHAFWWAAVHKLSRSFTLAVFDALLSGGIIAILVSVIYWIATQHTTANLYYQGMVLNVTVVFALLMFIILAVHRPLARVMLASSSLTAWQLVKFSFGMIIYNFGRTLIMGIWWMLMTALTVSIIAGISWATVNYGFQSANYALIGRILLGITSSVLIYAVFVAYILWNQGYWSMAYHYLAHRTYPAQVSRFFTTQPHTARRRVSIGRASIITAIFMSVLILSLAAAHRPLQDGWSRLQSNRANILDWFNRS